MCKKYLILIFLIIMPWNSNADRFEKQADYAVCFTPGQDCTQLIVDAIDNAVNTIWVQAYSFTSRPIGKALVTAQQRGVQVKIIFDKSILDYDHNSAAYFMKHRIPIWIDSQPAIAHNKVIIIDQTRVITGSFNFTRAAQQDNAENVLLIDDGHLAQQYLQNWQRRQAASKPLVLSAHDLNDNYSPQNATNWLERLWDWLIQWLRGLVKTTSENNYQ